MIALPWHHQQHRTKNCFIVPTEVKPSLIPEAGYGRFATAFIPKRTLLIKSPIISVDDINIYDPTKAIKIKNINELNYLVTRYQKQFKSLSKYDILNELRHFISFTVNNKHSMLLCSSGHVNHSIKNANLIPKISENYFCAFASKDIKPGDEIYCDYRVLRIPNQFDKYFKSYNLLTLNQFVDEIENSLKLKLSKL